jgi:hypothetical protein
LLTKLHDALTFKSTAFTRATKLEIVALVLTGVFGIYNNLSNKPKTTWKASG